MTSGSQRALFAVSMLCAAGTPAWATEYGTVVSSQPIVAAVPVPQQECSDQQVVYQRPNTGVGSLIGGVTGAAIGNSVGGGAGRAAATGLGLIAGAVIGNQVEANATPPVASTVRQCRTVTRYENRTIGYDVVYEYQGVRRHTQMAQDPGDRIALNVNVAPADAPPPPQAAVAPQAPAGYDPAPPQAYYPAPYYAAPYYVNPWPVVGVGLALGFGHGWGGGHYGHRH